MPKEKPAQKGKIKKSFQSFAEQKVDVDTMTEDTKIKVWTNDSVHVRFEDAEARTEKLLADSDQPFDAKVKLQKKGFVVKTWRGKQQSAPAAKKPKEEEPIRLYS